MADIGNQYPIQIQARETKEMKLKWIAARKQEAKSKLVHFKQAIEDLIQGKVPEIERQIMAVQQELQQLELQEKTLQSSVEAEQI
jgi:hypothetical protein